MRLMLCCSDGVNLLINLIKYVTMVITIVIFGGCMEIIASEFKAKCLHIMDEVARTGEAVIITKYGQPIAQLAPIRNVPDKIFGCMSNQMKVLGDIISPVDTEWNVMKDGHDI